MGSFNVACSVSNLSISSGTKVAFLPLLPSNYIFSEYGNEAVVNPIRKKSMILEPNEYFNPFCLPIIAQYNDYGSLENIVLDDNTKKIEEFFGITIQEFIDCVCCDRGITDHFGENFKSYGLNKELISNYQVKFNEEFLIAFGFKKLTEEDVNDHGTDRVIYQFEDCPYYVRIVDSYTKSASDGNGFELLKENLEVIHKNDGYDAREQLCIIFEKKAGYILNVSKENQRRVKLIQQLSSMFINYEIYEELANDQIENSKLVNNYVSENALKILGFEKINDKSQKTRYQNKNKEFILEKDSTAISILTSEGEVKEYYIFSSIELADHWLKITGEELDISPLYEICSYDVQFDNYKEAMTRLHEQLEDESLTEKEKDFIKLRASLKLNDFRGNDNLSADDFARFYERWDFFEEFYPDLIRKGKLKEAFKMYKGFYRNMYSCNRTFFPAMNGEQYGNDMASKLLLEKSLEIVNKKIKENG